MHLPWKCERCGAQNYHYGCCVESEECRAEAKRIRDSRQLLDLARSIDPTLPPNEELEGRMVTISLSKDYLGVHVAKPIEK